MHLSDAYHRRRELLLLQERDAKRLSRINKTLDVAFNVMVGFVLACTILMLTLPVPPACQ